MKASIDRANCIACGLCEGMCPDVFRMADGAAEVYVDVIPKALEKEVQEAADSCPVSVITVE